MPVNLEISETTVDELFDTGTPAERALLVLMFPAHEFPLNIMEKVTTFAEACALKSILPADITAITLPAALPTVQIMAFIRLCIITSALNETWVAEADPDQDKFWPLQEISYGAISAAEPFFSNSAIPSSSLALAFKSRELANYAGTQFLDDYIELSLDLVESP